MGMQQALARALEIEVAIGTGGGPRKHEFLRIQREQGLKAALEWRDRGQAS